MKLSAVSYKLSVCNSVFSYKWSRQESNLYLKFRKLLFYPLNYATFLVVCYQPSSISFFIFELHSNAELSIFILIWAKLKFLVKTIYEKYKFAEYFVGLSEITSISIHIQSANA